MIRLDHLLNLLLLERLLFKYGRERRELLLISFEMVTLTLHFWTHKHKWAGIQVEYQSLVSYLHPSYHYILPLLSRIPNKRQMMGYAAPAGAVLCMELVDPNPVNIAEDEPIIAGKTYSRSSIIQQLSLLVGFLNSSDPSQPTSTATSDVRGIIEKVLNHVLNQPLKQLQSPMGLETFDFATDWDNFAQFNSLDNMNWFSQFWGTEDYNGTQ
jgi:hypothetical protein